MLDWSCLPHCQPRISCCVLLLRTVYTQVVTCVKHAMRLCPPCRFALLRRGRYRQRGLRTQLQLVDAWLMQDLTETDTSTPRIVLGACGGHGWCPSFRPRLGGHRFVSWPSCSEQHSGDVFAFTRQLQRAGYCVFEFVFGLHSI